MIITVVAVRVVQVAFHQVIHVISMRYRLMAAIGAMPMRFLMPTALVVGSTSFGISRVHLKAMVVHMIAV
jgi:hypothetical protein